jgi:hypothetical protein
MRHRNDWRLSSRFDPPEDCLFGGECFLEEEDDSFSVWLDEQLEQLEQRHRDSRPRRLSIIVVIIS